MGKLHSMFRGWDVKRNILTPVLANIMTALILFLTVIVFKPAIFELLGLRQEASNYPLYCVFEPYNASGEKVSVDLFIINLTETTYDNQKLEVFIKALSTEKDVEMSPRIRLEMKKGFPGEITEIDQDYVFNEGKGEVHAEKVDDRSWAISVRRIEGRGILKLTIVTNHELAGISRNTKALLPFKTYYPGR